MGSLLEVGTGFHPELTGRENIFLNGAILGMSRREIARKFDEIVAFAELEQFLDTPVKRYSSGMYVRLAFAVAAHLEPEILLVDEVLAVGDAAFQKKCLGKMGDVAVNGRTVLFVSHNMGAINALCSRVLMMEDGGVVFNGPTAEATARYYAESLEVAESGADLLDFPREGNDKARFSSITIQPLSPKGDPLEVAHPGCDLSIETEVQCRSDISDCLVAVIFYDMNGARVLDTNTGQKGQYVSLSAGQKVRTRFLLRDVLLRPGKYFLGLWIGRQNLEAVDHIEHAATLEFTEIEANSKDGITYPGVYLCRFEHETTID